MGRGAALQAARRYPGVERECARAIQSSREAARANNSVWVYGFLVVRRPAHRQPGLGIFQVKGEYRTFAAWMEQADLSLVALSVAGLNEYARQHPGLAIRMNYPGIGNGGLRRDAVEPLLACLPENVTICYQ